MIGQKKKHLKQFLAALLISPEIYLWVNLITFCQVWLDKLSAHKKDGWANQYKAERGATKSKLGLGLFTFSLIVGIIIHLCVRYKESLTSEPVQQAIYPYLMSSWIFLTYLTIIASILMIYQIWTLRARHKA